MRPRSAESPRARGATTAAYSSYAREQRRQQCTVRTSLWLKQQHSTFSTASGRRGAAPARREERRVLVVRKRRVTPRARMDRRPLSMVEAVGVEPTSGSTPTGDPTGLARPEISPSPCRSDETGKG